MVNGRFGLYFIAYYIVSPVGKVLFKIIDENDEEFIMVCEL